MNILEHMSDFYDRQGKPITLFQFGELHKDTDYLRVGHDQIGDFEVSTAWLGANHNFSQKTTPPLIFETMIFRDSGGPNDFDNYQERYETEAKAIAGHQKAIQLVLDKTRIFVNDHQA